MNRQDIANIASSFFVLCFFGWIVGYTAVVVLGFDLWLVGPLIGFYFLAWAANVASGNDEEEEVGAVTAEDLED